MGISLLTRLQEEHLMKEGMEEGTNSSRAGKWIKEIFKKKEDGEMEQNEVSDETPAANGQKTVELAHISEEEEGEKDNQETKANGNGSIPHQPEETTEMENDENSGEAEKNESEGSDTKEDRNEEDENAANEKVEKEDEGKDSEARMQDGLVTYIAKEKEADNEKNINGVMRVFGRFMKKINPDPEEPNGQPPSYSEAVQESSDAEPAKNEEAPDEEIPVKETREASTQMDVGTQVDPEEMAKTDDETLEEDALPESERVPDVTEVEEKEEKSKEVTPVEDEPEPKFRFRLQRFFSD